jgi:hypothetical protein
MLVGGFVVAGLAAVLAVHQAIGANADVRHGLAEAAEFVAIAGSFGQVALCTVVFGRTGSGAHENNVARIGGPRKMTLVIAAVLERTHTTFAAVTPDFLRVL